MGKTAGKRLLLVEDEAILAMGERLLLERAGYEVRTAGSGEAALEAFGDGGDFDLVLMDVDLGRGMDGPEAARRLLRARELPVVFLSSHAEPEVIRKTEEVQSYGYVVKSTGIAVLDASIRRAFKLFEADRALRERETRYRSLYSNMIEGVALHE